MPIGIGVALASPLCLSRGMNTVVLPSKQATAMNSVQSPASRCNRPKKKYKALANTWVNDSPSELPLILAAICHAVQHEVEGRGSPAAYLNDKRC
jgi:hypothetical protein